MCISVHRSASPAVTIAPWNPTTLTITIPACLNAARSLIAVRAVLSELAIIQPADGAVCWCGSPVLLPRVPAQRTVEGARVAS
jgi:hypothetical protein